MYAHARMCWLLRYFSFIVALCGLHSHSPTYEPFQPNFIDGSIFTWISWTQINNIFIQYTNTNKQTNKQIYSSFVRHDSLLNDSPDSIWFHLIYAQYSLSVWTLVSSAILHTHTICMQITMAIPFHVASIVMSNKNHWIIIYLVFRTIIPRREEEKTTHRAVGWMDESMEVHNHNIHHFFLWLGLDWLVVLCVSLPILIHPVQASSYRIYVLCLGFRKK